MKDNELTKEQIERLRQLPAPLERKDLTCPDCLAPLILRVGKFGRFYGCASYPHCRTGISADTDGEPYGEVSSKEVRRSRHRLMSVIRRLDERRLPLPVIPSEGIGKLSGEECEVILKGIVDREPWVAEILEKIPIITRKTRYQRLMDDHHILDEILA